MFLADALTDEDVLQREDDEHTTTLQGSRLNRDNVDITTTKPAGTIVQRHNVE